MFKMDVDILEIVEILESLSFDEMPLKARQQIEQVISQLKIKHVETETLLKVQDEIEHVISMGNIDSFTRNELMNIVSIIETLL